MNNAELIRLAIECGATKATMIRADEIALSEEFLKICAQNSCGNYGKYYTCPPATGDIAQTMAEIASFDHALWYQTIGQIEDSFDYEGMVEVGAQHTRNCQRIHAEIAKKMHGRMRHLSCGGCTLCETCAKAENLPCRHPDRMLPAMEGWGVDVYNTTKNTELAYINGPNSVTFFGMLLFTEEDHA